MKYVITTISSFLMIHHKAVNCKQLWSKFSKYTPCKIFCALHTFEYGVSRHWKRKGDGMNLFTYIEKKGIIQMVNSFVIRAKISTKWQIYFWTKLIYIHFLHHAIRLTTGKNQCLWTCLLVCMRMACNCYQRRFTTQKYLHRLSFDKFPEIIML